MMSWNFDYVKVESVADGGVENRIDASIFGMVLSLVWKNTMEKASSVGGSSCSELSVEGLDKTLCYYKEYARMAHMPFKAAVHYATWHHINRKRVSVP